MLTGRKIKRISLLHTSFLRKENCHDTEAISNLLSANKEKKVTNLLFSKMNRNILEGVKNLLFFHLKMKKKIFAGLGLIKLLMTIMLLKLL